MNIPGFLIKGVLGHGAMATVYLARENSLARDVALKVISVTPDMDYTAIRRFLRECQILANLKHANIVTIYHLKQEKESIHMAMELMPKGSLKDRISRGLSQEASLMILRQIAEALEVAHHKDIVHRDIKPANILFMDENTPVLTDFGIARDPKHRANLTQEGATVGTPNYMSPEQVQGEPLDGRSDLYSLGIMLFEMLTGERPFQTKNAVQLALMHISKPVPQLPKRLAGLQPLVDRLLAKEPAHRFQSATALCQALDALALSPKHRLLADLMQIGESDPKGSALRQTYQDLSAVHRARGMALLLHEAQRMLHTQRNYSLGLSYVNCLRLLLSQEEEAKEQSKIAMDRWRVKLQSIWLEVQNQERNFVGNQSMVAKAVSSARALGDAPVGWEDWQVSARFYNLLAVNFLNVLAFEKANRLLKTYVDYFRKYCEDTPLGPMRSRWIGALFGTFAQTLSFSAHAVYFRQGDLKRAEILTGGALQYSEKALQHFQLPQDRAQQYTYQAQAHLQYFLLSKQSQYLSSAVKLLVNPFSPQETVSAFLAAFPGCQAITWAYRIAAWLKWAWLSGHRPDWLTVLQTGLIPKIEQINASHPYQQILGYLALLEESPVMRHRLLDQLTRLRWKNVIAVNAALFMAQIEYAQQRTFSEKIRLSIATKLASLAKKQPFDDTSPYAYIQKEFERFNTPEEGPLPEPLAILPLYYS